MRAEQYPPPHPDRISRPYQKALGRREIYPKLGGEYGEDLSYRFAAVYRQAAEELGCHFLDAAPYAQPSDADGLHWEPESHRRLADAMVPAVRKIFEEAAR